MTSVRAKFLCHEKTQTEHGHQVKLRPVHDGSDENKAFYRWTPGGEISLGLMNPPAAEAFSVGVEYYVDFTPAPKV